MEELRFYNVMAFLNNKVCKLSLGMERHLTVDR